VSEDRETEREEGQKRPSRPVTAAARRERRGTTRPSARAAGEGRTSETTAPKAKAKGERAATDSGDKKSAATPKRDRKEKRASPPARLMRFLREVVAELRKVIWPTRKQMITYTAVVLVFVAFMVAVISGLDIALAKGVFWLFG
jgi:preprotein translocase subunit SecE